MKIYSVYDKKAMTYGPLLVFPQPVFAIRMVEMEVMKGNSPVAMYPADFCIICLGEFDQDSGKITPYDTPENVYECLNAVRKENEA